MRAPRAAAEHRPGARRRPAPDRHRASGRPARQGRLRPLPGAVRRDRPAPGPLRARHLHGGHRFHARRRAAPWWNYTAERKAPFGAICAALRRRRSGYRTGRSAGGLFAASSHRRTTNNGQPGISSGCPCVTDVRPRLQAPVQQLRAFGRRRRHRSPRSESVPPLARRRTVAWVRRLGERSRGEALAAGAARFRRGARRHPHTGRARACARASPSRARCTSSGTSASEVFSLVACRHGQARGAGRLAELDLHFARRDRG